MKKITSLLIIALMALNSCSPVATTKIQKSYTALKKNAPILVYMSGDELPSNPENIGDIKIGDSGFTTECSFDQVIEKAKVKAREVGGNAIQIYDVKRPDLMSTCYRIKAKILKIKIERETELSEEKLKEVWGENGINNIEGIYENVVETSTSPKYKLACKKQDDDNYTLVYLNGAKGDFSQLWKEGDIKAKLYKTASQIFKVDWFMANKSIEKNLYILFEEGLMKIIWTQGTREQLYLKLYPTSESKGSDVNNSLISSGTGFAINETGYILTNYHVIENANEVIVRGINNNFKQDFKAEIVFSDKNNDLAVIKINDNKFNHFSKIPYTFKFNISDVGENVFALGYPLRATMGDEIKLTNGIISSKTGFQGDISSYQISVPIQPGNSGGPLLDDEGNIIAIINAKHRGAENASYAVKVSYLKNLLELSDSEIKLNKLNDLSSLSLADKVKEIKNFVFIIECK